MWGVRGGASEGAAAARGELPKRGEPLLACSCCCTGGRSAARPATGRHLFQQVAIICLVGRSRARCGMLLPG